MFRRTDPESKTRTARNAERLGPLLKAAQGVVGDLVAEAVSEAAQRAKDDPRWQEASQTIKQRAKDLKTEWRDRADERLDQLRQRATSENEELWQKRQQERQQRREQAQARAQLLAQAQTNEERRVLSKVAERTHWTGGTGKSARYTELLDLLAPSGDAAQEMAIHRAIWGLAERRTLRVSEFGEVRAELLEETP